MEERYFEYFGVKFDSKKTKKYLNRDNFAIIDTNCGNDQYIRYRTENWEYFEKIKPEIDISNRSINTWPPSYKYCMENGKLRFSDEFCKKYQEACLNVFDANMKYFEKLNRTDFNEKIDKLIKKYRNFIKVDNLNDFKGKSGIYIMVLDEYKQVYIGQSKDIYKRILAHWKRTPPFDSLIFPSVEKSNIPIDSFGVYDTTRIYIKEIQSKSMYGMDKEEEKIVNAIPQEFLANRVCGGLRLSTISDYFKALESVNRRNLES